MTKSLGLHPPTNSKYCCSWELIIAFKKVYKLFNTPPENVKPNSPPLSENLETYFWWIESGRNGVIKHLKQGIRRLCGCSLALSLGSVTVVGASAMSWGYTQAHYREVHVVRTSCWHPVLTCQVCGSTTLKADLLAPV